MPFCIAESRKIQNLCINLAKKILLTSHRPIGMNFQGRAKKRFLRIYCEYTQKLKPATTAAANAERTGIKVKHHPYCETHTHYF